MSKLVEVAALQLEQNDPNAIRRAAWLTRSALEETIETLLAAKHMETGTSTSARAKLSCLEAVYRDSEPHTASRAQYAWSRLSEACHQHAYELSPTYSEVKHLIEIVRGLTASTD